MFASAADASVPARGAYDLSGIDSGAFGASEGSAASSSAAVPTELRDRVMHKVSVVPIFSVAIAHTARSHGDDYPQQNWKTRSDGLTELKAKFDTADEDDPIFEEFGESCAGRSAVMAED